MQLLKTIKPLTEFSGNSPQIMYIIVLENLLFSKNFVSRKKWRGPAVLMHHKRQDLKSESSSLNKNLHPVFLCTWPFIYVFLIQRFVYSGKVHLHPNWWEATSWLITSMAKDLNSSSKWPEQDSNLGPSDCQPDALTTWPCCLPQDVSHL